MGNKLLAKFNVPGGGTGNSVVVLSHGFGSDQSAWNPVIPALTTDFWVIVYDLACAGSVNPDDFDVGKYSMLDGYVDDLCDILDTLGVSEVCYVGHSVSAMIGVLAAIRRPELFRKLVLLCFSPRFINDHDYHGGFDHREAEKVFGALMADYEKWVASFAQLVVGPDDHATREFSSTLFKMRPEMTLSVSKMFFSSDIRGQLGLIDVPCSIIQSKNDMLVPGSVNTYLEAQLAGRGCSLEILETKGHLPHLTAPTVLIPALRRALIMPEVSSGEWPASG